MMRGMVDDITPLRRQLAEAVAKRKNAIALIENLKRTGQWPDDTGAGAKGLRTGGGRKGSEGDRKLGNEHNSGSNARGVGEGPTAVVGKQVAERGGGEAEWVEASHVRAHESASRLQAQAKAPSSRGASSAATSTNGSNTRHDEGSDASSYRDSEPPSDAEDEPAQPQPTLSASRHDEPLARAAAAPKAQHAHTTPEKRHVHAHLAPPAEEQHVKRSKSERVMVRESDERESAGYLRLEEHLDMLKSVIEEERAARQRLERKLEALDASISPLKGRHSTSDFGDNAAKGRASGLAEGIDAADAAEMAAGLQQAGFVVDTMAGHLHQAEKLLKEHSLDLAMCKKELAASQETVKSLESLLKGKSEEDADANVDSDGQGFVDDGHLKKELDACKKALAHRESELQAFKEASQKRDVELEACKEEMGSLRDDVEEHELELELAKKKLEQLQQELDDCKEQLEARGADQQGAEAPHAAEHALQEIGELKAVRVDLEMQLAASQTALEASKAEIQELEAARQGLDKLLAESKKAKGHRSREAHAVAANAQQLEELQASLRQCEKNLAEAEEEHAKDLAKAAQAVTAAEEAAQSVLCGVGMYLDRETLLALVKRRREQEGIKLGISDMWAEYAPQGALPGEDPPAGGQQHAEVPQAPQGAAANSVSPQQQTKQTSAPRPPVAACLRCSELEAEAEGLRRSLKDKDKALALKDKEVAIAQRDKDKAQVQPEKVRHVEYNSGEGPGGEDASALQQTVKDLLSKVRNLELSRDRAARKGTDWEEVALADTATQCEIMATPGGGDDSPAESPTGDQEGMKELLAMVQESLSEQQDVTEQLRKQNSKLVQQVAKEQSKIAGLEEEVISAREQMKKNMDELGGSRCEARGLRDEVDLLKKALDDLERNHQQEDVLVDQITDNMKVRTLLTQEQCDEIDAVLDRGDYEEMEASLRDFVVLIRKHNQEAGAGDGAVRGNAGGDGNEEALRSEIAGLKEELSELKKKSKAEGKKSKDRALLKELEELREENGELKHALKQATSGSEGKGEHGHEQKMRKELDELEAELLRLKDKLVGEEPLKVQIGRLELEQMGLKKERNTLRGRQQELEQQMLELQEELSAAKAGKKGSGDEKLRKKLEQELEMVRAGREQEAQEFKSALDSMSAELSNVTKELLETREALQSSSYPPQGAGDAAGEGASEEGVRMELERLREELQQATRREEEAIALRRKDEADMMNKLVEEQMQRMDAETEITKLKSQLAKATGKRK